MYIHFSEPGKMPCHAWSLPTAMCQSGQKYRLQGDLTGKPFACRVCYAHLGPTSWNKNQGYLTKNWEAYAANPDGWVIEIADAIWNRLNALYFRWNHSGDIQSAIHLGHLVGVAELCPKTFFWLPTSEFAFVSRYLRDGGDIPKNLCVRVSAPLIDGKPRILRRPHPQVAYSRVVYHEVDETLCPAHRQEGVCGKCRRCWDINERLVSYPLKVGYTYWPLLTANRLGLIK